MNRVNEALVRLNVTGVKDPGLWNPVTTVVFVAVTPSDANHTPLFCPRTRPISSQIPHLTPLSFFADWRWLVCMKQPRSPPARLPHDFISVGVTKNNSWRLAYLKCQAGTDGDGVVKEEDYIRLFSFYMNKF